MQDASRPWPLAQRSALATKLALGLVSLLVLGVTGYAWASLQDLSRGMTSADVLVDRDDDEQRELGGDPDIGARNILLAGIGDRRDVGGELLPDEVRSELDLGDDLGPGRADTIMLVRVPEDGEAATGFSIPRDAYVDLPGFGQHRINSAYTRGKAAERQRLEERGLAGEEPGGGPGNGGPGEEPGGEPGSGELDGAELERRTDAAGARTLVAAVEELTGQPVDNYASINMFGFHELTEAIGGVRVCLNDDVTDDDSGADFAAGVQQISGAEALAFVRQRQGLPRGDLDRVQRQQAYLAGLAREILSAGTLTDRGQLRELTGAIQDSIVLDRDWEVLDFAQHMSGLSSGQVEFHTVPVGDIVRVPGEGEVLEIEPTQVQEFIAEQTSPHRADGHDTDQDTEQDAEQDGKAGLDQLAPQRPDEDGPGEDGSGGGAEAPEGTGSDEPNGGDPTGDEPTGEDAITAEGVPCVN